VTDHLLVLMGDRIAGTLTQRGQTLSFAYGAAYAEDSDSTPLSLSMPLAIETYAGTHLSNWLWGLLPDNSRVIDEWSRRFSVSPSTPYGLLGSAVGEDCPGAIRFVRPERLDAVLDGPGVVEPLTERDIERRLDSLRRDGATWLGTRFDGRFSLAGAQAKTALVLRDGVWGDARGSAATTHIIKPAVALERQDIVGTSASTPRAGQACLLRRAGSCTLVMSGPSSWSATTDRSGTGSFRACTKRTCARHSGGHRARSIRSTVAPGLATSRTSSVVP